MLAELLSQRQLMQSRREKVTAVIAKWNKNDEIIDSVGSAQKRLSEEEQIDSKEA